jgi:hypothetical protein
MRLKNIIGEIELIILMLQKLFENLFDACGKREPHSNDLTHGKKKERKKEKKKKKKKTRGEQRKPASTVTTATVCEVVNRYTTSSQ